MRVATGDVLGGLKMANGENPKRCNYGSARPAPATRMKMAALQREQFVKAQEYQRAVGRAIARPRPRPTRGRRRRNAISRWSRWSRCWSASAPSTSTAIAPTTCMTAVRLAEEFDFELVLQHGTEGYRVAEELVKRQDPRVADAGGQPRRQAGGRRDCSKRTRPSSKRPASRSPSTPTTRSPNRGSSCGPGPSRCAAACPRSGPATPDLHGAQMLHLDDRLGSLEKGKDADFVVLSGPPFSVYTQVLQTYIDGVKRLRPLPARSDWTLPGRRFRPGRPRSACRNAAAGQAARRRPGARAPPAQGPGARTVPDALAVLAGRLHTVAQGDHRRWRRAVENGKIKAVGAARRAQDPARHAAC